MQFQTYGGVIRPCGETIGKLEPGLYAPVMVPEGFGESPAIHRISKVVTDKLLVLDDSPIERVTQGIDRFWKAKAKYAKHGIVHKRGILLEGPPGTGKSSIAYKVSEWVVKQGGIVLITEHRNVAALRVGLSWIREVQDTPIFVVIEDFDKFMPEEDWEDYIDDLMQMMDGHLQVENIVYMLTTNFIDRIDPRFLKRPSRIDETLHVGKPSEKMRRAYLTELLREHDVTSEKEIGKWVKAADGLYIAHMREMVLAIMVLGHDFDVTVDRLKSMVATDEELKGTSKSQKRLAALQARNR